MTKARDSILGRIRAASTGPRALYGDLPRDYIRRGSLATPDCVALMVERLGEYDAEVVETTPGALPTAIAAQLSASGRHTFAAPAGLPSDWLASGFTWKLDNNIDYAAIESADGVVTASSAGIADSGTIVLHHKPAEGRRVLSLLPDWHLCILRATDIVETLPQYFARFPHPPALATYISGPSATADIEMTRIKGVHGPRFLHVIIVRGETPHDAPHSTKAGTP